MLLLTFILFILTATGGFYLLSYVLRDKKTPKNIAMIHGSLGVLATILLSINAYHYPWILLLFILVAMGGGFLMMMDIMKKKIPKAAALAHGLLALTGVTLLGLVIAKII